MVNAGFARKPLIVTLCLALAAMVGALVAVVEPVGNGARAQVQVTPPAPMLAAPQPVPEVTPPEVKPALPLPVADVLQSGVLIVVSKPTQRMHVFRDGVPWAVSPVSTGRRGHGTPSGVFPILQKARFHRSNIYSNAPMPFMQRLTWGGIAIHAGYVPGYPASHGCIRVPYGFASALFRLTRADRTTVVVTGEAVRDDRHAVSLALNGAAPPRRVLQVEQAALEDEPELPPVGETIQLAAAPSVGEAEAHWAGLVAAWPELARFRKSVVPAVVGSRQLYRLRASAPGARAMCTTLKRAGQDCFSVS
jgi:lipoprotein-anchoring transpeptidase ErfK/SrfK